MNKEVRYVLDSIASATYTALDELGLDAAEAQDLIEQVLDQHRTHGPIRVASLDYVRKVKMCGGPKPRTAEV